MKWSSASPRSSFELLTKFAEYKDLLIREFDLSYVGRLGTLADIQEMPVFEADWHHQQLATRKREEAEEQKRAAQRAQEASRSGGAMRSAPIR